MRVVHLPLLAYSLSLLTVVAGQSQGLGDVITSIAPVPTSKEVPATSTTEEETTEESSSPPSTSSSSTSSEEEPSETPTPSETPPPSSTEVTPTETTSTSSTSTTSDESDESDESDAVTPSTTAPTNTQTEDSTPTVKVITTVHTVSGTPVPTTMTSTSSETQGATGAEATSTPGLSKESSGGDDSGITEDQKKIIIGVVVGVGGAILIGAIGVVFWRISRKRNAARTDEDTDLMSGTAVGTGAREKAPSPGVGGTPFRSTLDQYHNPGPVNAASNF